MHHTTRSRSRLTRSLAVALALAPAPAPAEEVHEVARSTVEAWRTVYAVVAGVERTPARARLTGLVDALSVDEGERVEEGERIALVRAPELAARIEAARADLRRARAEREAAREEIERVRPLVESGTAPEARLDEVERRFESAEAQVENARAALERLDTRRERGRVLAPRAGTVLRVEVTLGTRMQAGETLAIIAAGPEVLRLEAPERHADLLREADRVGVLAGGAPREAEVLKVYPEIRRGRVRADLDADALSGPRFTGRRIGVRLPAGTRETIVVPRAYLSTRDGLAYAHRENAGPVLVQTGRAWAERVEVLSGLKPGDRLVRPDGEGG